MKETFIFLGLVWVFFVAMGLWAIKQKPSDTKAA